MVMDTILRKGEESVMSEYEVTVYRTVQQSTVITVESDRPLTDTERGFIRMKAEDEAADTNDFDWDTLDIQIEYDETQVKKLLEEE